MTMNTLERKPAQISPALHQWATVKAAELDVSIADVWRGVPAMLEQAERLGIRLTVQSAQPEHQAQP